MSVKKIASAILLLVVAGCASPGPSNFGAGAAGSPSDYRIVAGSELPSPRAGDQTNNERPYYIGAFDKLRIDVFGVPELSKQEIQADASGRISFPLVGVVDAGGKTPGELATSIEGGLARFVRNPDVTVNLQETVSQVVTVDGAVTEPGLYPVIGKMTLMRAVARAKGLTEFARTSQVAIFRNVDGKQMAAVYDLKAIREGRYADPEVFANDVVVVGDSQLRRVFKDVLTAAPLFTTPLILLFQR
jgi:polysaccharide export outer membrane protein